MDRNEPRRLVLRGVLSSSCGPGLTERAVFGQHANVLIVTEGGDFGARLSGGATDYVFHYRRQISACIYSYYRS